MISRVNNATYLILFAIFLLPLNFMSADDTQELSGLVYGKDYSFWIDAPKGWVLDPKTAKEYGVDVVLYQKGFSFRNSPAVMYTSKLTTEKNVQETMEHEADAYREGHEGIEISKLPNIQTKDKKTAHVQNYKLNKKDQTDEAVAFIQEKEFYVLLVLSANSNDIFNMAYPAFEEVVQSYALSDINVVDDTE